MRPKRKRPPSASLLALTQIALSLLGALAFHRPLPPARPARTRLSSDRFLNFEGLKKRYNMTHFSDPELDSQAPTLPEEDYATRPDLVKARAIAQTLAGTFGPEHHLTVSLYFHVGPLHLQSFKEALQARHAEPGSDVLEYPHHGCRCLTSPTPYPL